MSENDLHQLVSFTQGEEISPPESVFSAITRLAMAGDERAIKPIVNLAERLSQGLYLGPYQPEISEIKDPSNKLNLVERLNMYERLHDLLDTLILNVARGDSIEHLPHYSSPSRGEITETGRAIQPKDVPVHMSDLSPPPVPVRRSPKLPVWVSTSRSESPPNLQAQVCIEYSREGCFIIIEFDDRDVIPSILPSREISSDSFELINGELTVEIDGVVYNWFISMR
ncbi:MAG: hypothetical protein VYD89_00410 [Candidatus Thermoplasmatota archaeon]|nr:hypothetical protein [Candidatus Thermoplasmatota archaeon]